MLVKIIALSALLVGPALAATKTDKRGLPVQGFVRRQATRSEIAARGKRDDLVRRQGASPVPVPKPVCQETVFKAEVVGTGMPTLDGNYARIHKVTFDDGTISYVLPTEVTTIDQAATFRLGTDCSLSTTLPSGDDIYLDTGAKAPENGFGGAYFDPLDAIQQNGYLQPTCSTNSEGILGCAIQNLNNFVVCFTISDGQPVLNTPFVLIGDPARMSNDQETCVALNVKAVPTTD